MEQRPKIEFETGKTYKVELLFDSPKTGKNAKGNDWYLYSVKHDGIEKNFFANDYALHNKVNQFTKGDVIEITDKYEGDNQWAHDWHVVSVGSNKPLDEQMKSRQSGTEIKIETFAAMKIASAFSKDLDELKVNTHGVLTLHQEICRDVKNERELFS